MVRFTPCTCDQIHGPIYTQPVLVIKSMVPFTPCICVCFGVKLMLPFTLVHPVLLAVVGSNPWSDLHPVHVIKYMVPFTPCTFVSCGVKSLVRFTPCTCVQIHDPIYTCSYPWSHLHSVCVSVVRSIHWSHLYPVMALRPIRSAPSLHADRIINAS